MHKKATHWIVLEYSKCNKVSSNIWFVLMWLICSALNSRESDRIKKENESMLVLFQIQILKEKIVFIIKKRIHWNVLTNESHLRLAILKIATRPLICCSQCFAIDQLRSIQWDLFFIEYFCHLPGLSAAKMNVSLLGNRQFNARAKINSFKIIWYLFFILKIRISLDSFRLHINYSFCK